MRTTLLSTVSLLGWTAILAAHTGMAQDWPQWRGPNRDARATGFEAPANWPEELTEKWQLTVGEGVASPSLKGDKLYVFSRQDGQEILRCLNAATGDEIWTYGYEAEAIRGPAASFDGPRSSPTVADAVVVTLGAQGMLSCVNADSGELVWRNDENVGNVPRFATSSSPMVVDGLVITEFGEDENGGLAAYELRTGAERWRWTDSGASYGSPVQITLGDVEAIVSPMSDKMVVLAAADGSSLWEMPYRQGRYNSATPIVSESKLIMAGPDSGITALRFNKQGEGVTVEEVWKNADNSVGFNTPVLKDGMLYGISNLNSLFCLNVETGETVWNSPLGEQSQAQNDRQSADRGDADGDRRRSGRRGRRGGRGGGGYGSVVDAGAALLALIPSGQLTVFTPGDEFTSLAQYRVAEAGTYAYPVPSRYGLFIKDQDSVTLWSTQ
jgi:outer membrane protein assembly factor BamB